MSKELDWPDPNTCRHIRTKNTGNGVFCWVCGAQVVADEIGAYVLKFKSQKPPAT